MRRSFLALLLSTLFATVAVGETFPERRIRIVVPFAPGGPTDVIARLMSEKMSITLKQPILIENVTGAGGLTGTQLVANAPPDGYTLLLHNNGIAALPSISSVSFDVIKAFSFLGLINEGPMMVVVRADHPANDLKTLRSWLAANPDRALAGHSGVGSAPYICLVQLQAALEVGLRLVPYRGAAPSMNDLLGGNVALLCDLPPNSVPQLEARTIKALALVGKRRFPSLPTVATVEEQGYGIDVDVWNGFYAPAGTPDSVQVVLRKALAVVVDDARFAERSLALGLETVAVSDRDPEAHRRRVEKNVQRIRHILSGLNGK